MATVLIVEGDGLVARGMARTLRQAGHTPILAPDARSAQEEAADRPDIILLNLGLPDLPGEVLLHRLKTQPETAHTPVVVITGRKDAAAQLKGSVKSNAAAILLKPVSGAQVRQVVEIALAAQQALEAAALRRNRECQRELIFRLIAEGSDSLAFNISRRLCADRARTKGPAADAPTWAEIAERGKREGLLDAEQSRLLCRVPLAGPEEAGG